MKSLNCPLFGEQMGLIGFTRVLAGGGTPWPQIEVSG
jgi:hypothetical protein